jgi:hypothetical protein
MIHGAAYQSGVVRAPGNICYRTVMIRETVQHGESPGFVHQNRVILASGCQLSAIMRELQVPNLVCVTIELEHRSQRKVVSLTRVVRIERGRRSPVVVKAVVDLTLFDLFEEMC